LSRMCGYAGPSSASTSNAPDAKTTFGSTHVLPGVCVIACYDFSFLTNCFYEL
jgi:hypothetical protein